MSRHLSQEEAIAVLQSTAVFGQLDVLTLGRLAEESSVRSYRRRDIVFHQGDPGDCLYVVARGLLKVFTISEQGDEMLMATLRQADTFGDLALIDGGPRSASVEALQPTVLLAVGRTAFTKLGREYPSLLEALLRSVARLVRQMLERTSDLVFLDLGGRVAKALVDQAEEHGTVTPGGIRVEMELTQGDLAALVGGARSTVNQILKTFEARGYLTLDGKTLLLINLEALRKRAGG